MLLRRYRTSAAIPKIEVEETNTSENEVLKSKLEGMSVEELKIYAEQNNINIGNSTSAKGILKKILDAVQE